MNNKLIRRVVIAGARFAGLMVALFLITLALIALWLGGWAAGWW